MENLNDRIEITKAKKIGSGGFGKVFVAYDKQLEKEVEICDLINKCYGKEAYAVVKMYLDMNENGRKLAFDLISNLHSNPQNTEKRESAAV